MPHAQASGFPSPGNARGGQAPALRYQVAVFFHRENRENPVNPAHVFSLIREIAGDRPPRYGNNGTRTIAGDRGPRYGNVGPSLAGDRPPRYVPGAFKKFRIT